jgi:hypothetical protein
LTRIFYLSVLAGAILVVALAGAYPLPQHERYRSAIDVIPDGGREESFVIQWPQDRVELPDSPGLSRAGAAMVLADPRGEVASAELFKLRDTSGNIVGLASRAVSRRQSDAGKTIQGTDWILLLPARGTVFLSQVNSRDVGPRPGADGSLASAQESPGFWAGASRYRITAGPVARGAGEVTGGTGEFADLRGSYDEDWEFEGTAASGTARGRILLSTRMQAAP